MPRKDNNLFREPVKPLVPANLPPPVKGLGVLGITQPSAQVEQVEAKTLKSEEAKKRTTAKGSESYWKKLFTPTQQGIHLRLKYWQRAQAERPFNHLSGREVIDRALYIFYDKLTDEQRAELLASYDQDLAQEARAAGIDI